MAKTAKQSAQVKGRQTKLEKKSREELVNIILKKDKTEAAFKKNILNLKSEVNDLTSRVNNFDKDQEGNVNEIKKLRDRVTVLNDNLSNKMSELQKMTAKANSNYDMYANQVSLTQVAENKARIYKNIAIFIGVIFVVTITFCGILV